MTPPKSFREYIVNNKLASTDSLAEVLSYFSEKEYLKQEYFQVHHGHDQFMAYLEQGSVIYFDNNGEDANVVDLLFEGDWIALLNQTKPQHVRIQFLENSKIWLITETRMNELCLKFPAIANYRAQVIHHYLAVMTQRYLDQTSLRSEERLKKLMIEQADLFQRVPQYYIASYLGIKPPSLSRLRKNLAGKIS